MATNQSVPGLMYPTQKAMLSGNPRDSAMQQMTDTNNKQAALSAAVGGRRRRHKGGAANTAIPVPQFQMQYTPQGGPGRNPNNQIQQNSQISTQGKANAVYDLDATKMGGRRRHTSRSRKGGNPNWNWGCSSGGKRKTKKSRKTRKSRKTKKYRK